MKCFAIMPFGSPFDEYYTSIVRPALSRVAIEVTRADEIYGTRPIISDIVESIVTSDLIIADVSGKNPNVNYELGLAHALNKPVLIMSSSIDDVPFDYRHIRVIIYDRMRPEWAENLRSRISTTAEQTLRAGPETGISIHLEMHHRQVALTHLAGLAGVYLTRQRANAELDRLWAQASLKLDIIAFGLKSFRDSQTTKIIEKIKLGLKVRILSPRQDSQAVVMRELEEKGVSGSISKTIDDLLKWQNTVNIKSGVSDGVSIKLYNESAQDFYWRQDGNIFFGPYLYGIGSQQTPTFQAKADSELGQFYASYFESLWDDSAFGKVGA